MMANLSTTLRGAALSAALLCFAGDAFAQALEPDTIPVRERFTYNFDHVHDRGVYMRLGLGGGYVSDKITPGIEQAEDVSSGARWLMGAHLGMLVVPRFALHLSHFGELGADRGALGLGAGVTFYPIESSNWLLGVSLGGVTAYDEAPDIVLGEQWGFGGEAEVGMGWWVGSRTSLGLSVVTGAHAFDLDGDRIASSAWHVGLRVSVSLN